MSNKCFFGLVVIVLSALCFLSCKNGENNVQSTDDSSLESISDIIAETSDSVGIIEESDTMNFAYIDEAEILKLMELSFDSIEEAGYVLDYRYSVNGPGAPTYTINGYDGINIRFSTDDNFEVNKSSSPWLIEVYNPSVSIFGFKVGMSSQDGNELINEWDDVGFSAKYGVYYTAKKMGKYSFVVEREIPEKEFNEFCEKNDINKEDYDVDYLYYNILPEFFETQKRDPNGQIIKLVIDRYFYDN